VSPSILALLQEKPKQENRNRAALLLIDLQVGLFDGSEKPYQAEQLIENVNTLIDQARQNNVPIFAVRHTGPAGSPVAAGSPWWQLHPQLALNPEQDVLFDKFKSSCFIGTALLEQLREQEIQHIVIAGMKTQYCVDTNCRAAAEHGFQVSLIADAHSCMDTAALPAASIIAHHNATLQGAIADVIRTSDFRF